MIRKYENSKITILNKEQLESFPTNIFYIIQINEICGLSILEIINNDDKNKLVLVSNNNAEKTTIKPEEKKDPKIEEYRRVILNSDPFGKFSGKTLGQIIDANDYDWLDKCRSQMQNNFIKSRIEYLTTHQ